MVTRDKNDPRNKEEVETGPGGVRMVVMADLFSNGVVTERFEKDMLTPGSRMFDELSKMKVGRAEEGSDRLS